ncbi:hypothetical protein [Amycolatopsis sp. lyj-346]|uniref:hypothetical protein n=1 Tax=Amycolatopsis sp. lyj-346 TaxID=2789289 RepID=UPI0039784235
MTADGNYEEIETGEVPKEFFEGLGRLVFEFGRLDGALGSLLSVQVQPGTGYVAGLLSQGESTDWLRNRCVSVLESEGPFSTQETEALLTLLRKAKGLISLRNRYVHTYWDFFHPKSASMHGYQERRHSEAYEYFVTVAEVTKTAEDARRLTEDIEAITERVTLPKHERARALARAAAILRDAVRKSAKP